MPIENSNFIINEKAYSTHLVALKAIHKVTPLKNVLEFGCGLYSTKFFAENCEESVISIEMLSKWWYDTVKESINQIN